MRNFLSQLKEKENKYYKIQQISKSPDDIHTTKMFSIKDIKGLGSLVCLNLKRKFQNNLELTIDAKIQTYTVAKPLILGSKALN